MTSSDYNNRGGMYVIKPWRRIKTPQFIENYVPPRVCTLCAVSLFIEIQFVLKPNTHYTYVIKSPTQLPPATLLLDYHNNCIVR